ncbi:glycosyltransferase family 4 protein [Salinimicrobium sp. CDJ15-81-2]|nr:glycosyltransferase family 4 protein [Salinimicrobium nanhaiense]
MQNKQKNKILIVAESIDVEDSSGSKVNVALVYSLKKAGYNIQVYHYTRKQIQLDGIKCVAINEKRCSALFFLSRTERFLRNKLNLDLHKPLEKAFGFSFTLFNDRDSIVSCLSRITDFKPDLVLTLSKGGSFRPHHALLKMPEWHQKWMAYIHDPYPMHLYPRPYAWVEPGYLQKWRFVKAVSQKAKFAAFPSKLLMEWMGSYFKCFLKTGIVMPHQMQDLNSNIELPEYIDPELFNVVHAGNLLHARNPEGLIKGFELFLSKVPEAKSLTRLIFIGSTQYFQEYLGREARLNDNLKFIKENRPLEEVDLVQKSASVNVILEAKSEISPFLPGKFPYCVSANKPILLLGPYYSESRRLLDDNYPYWAEIDDVEKIARHLEDLFKIWKENAGDLKLNLPNLEYYLSEKYLKETVDRILEKNS